MDEFQAQAEAFSRLVSSFAVPQFWEFYEAALGSDRKRSVLPDVKLIGEKLAEVEAALGRLFPHIATRVAAQRMRELETRRAHDCFV